MKSLTLAAIGLAVAAASASAHEITAGALTIIHPHVIETTPTAMSGAGYMVISNDGESDDYLIGVEADYPRVTMHTTQMNGDTAMMVHVDRLTIPAGDAVVFEPGGLHVMFMGLNGRPFTLGQTIPATLVFEHQGRVDIRFMVQERDGDAGDHTHMTH